MGEGGGASSSRGARPAPLRAPARPTQPLEPILIPKLRIRLADFPYLHCSNMPEAVHLGDLLRIWVRPGARFTPSPPDFQGPARAHRTPPEPRRFPRHGPLSRGEPIPGRPALHKEKRTLPGAPAGFSGIGRVTALDASRRPSPPLRIRGSEPDSLSIGRGQRRPSPVPSERHSPISQDRLTHVQLLFTWNPSPLRPSKFSTAVHIDKLSSCSPSWPETRRSACLFVPGAGINGSPPHLPLKGMFLNYFIILCVWVFCLHVCLCPWRALDFLELTLQTVMNHSTSVGNQTQVL